jgi:hypothetical protein
VENTGTKILTIFQDGALKGRKKVALTYSRATHVPALLPVKQSTAAKEYHWMCSGFKSLIIMALSVIFSVCSGTAGIMRAAPA